MSRSRGRENAPQDVWTQILAEKAAAAQGKPAASPEAGATPEGAAGSAPVKVAAQGLETFLLFVGSKQSGKTTLITQFLNRSKLEDKPKPTVALEYTFGRRSNTTSNVKDIAHIWELGGGVRLRELINVPITPQRTPHAVVVVVVDLSKPNSALSSALTWLQLVEARVRECVTKIKRSDPAKLVPLQEAAAARVNPKGDHPDAKKVDPSVVPIVIVASKYDKFMDHESSRRKPLMLALRYIAHHYGASLICTSEKDKTQLAYFRAMLNHYVFHTEAKKTAHLDPSKPLIVPCGSDSFDGIGTPPGARRAQMEDGNIASRMQNWAKAVDTYFPPGEEDGDDDAVEAVDAEAWLEPVVDAMRAQKQEELDLYIKAAKQKLRLEVAANKGRSGRRERRGKAASGAGAGAGAGSRRKARDRG